MTTDTTLTATEAPMTTDTIGEQLVRAAERLRGSHPAKPYVTVTATLRVSENADAADCRTVYEARADGGHFVAWAGTGGTLDEAVAECLAEMSADPDAGLKAECDRRGYELVKREAVPS